MTIEETVKKMLEDNGMFPQQAQAVIDVMKADKANEAMEHRWSDDANGYPPALLAVLRMAMNRAALEWIDANLPMAWYRPMFEPQA